MGTATKTTPTRTKRKVLFELDYSPGGTGYALYELDRDGDRLLPELLSRRYARALVMGLQFAKGGVLVNKVPLAERLLLTSTSRYPRTPSFAVGKYYGLGVEDVLEEDPAYLCWFYRKVIPFHDQPPHEWRRLVVGLKAHILWHLPKIALENTGGPLFTAYQPERRPAPGKNRVAGLLGGHDAERIQAANWRDLSRNRLPLHPN
jgi:hypothetical protein